MKATKHTAIYARVSTGRQDLKSQTPDLKRWEQANDGRAKWFTDKYTGRKMDRPGMNDLLKHLRAGKLDRLVVWRLDRLGRTTRGLCELFDELRERRVNLVSLRDGFSLDSPGGRMIARIMASVAEYEVEVRAERVRAGQAVARANGKRWGGSQAGRYAKVSEAQVEAITQMADAGERITRIARITGLSRPTVYRVLRNQEQMKQSA